jgi:hypothetical protein
MSLIRAVFGKNKKGVSDGGNIDDIAGDDARKNMRRVESGFGFQQKVGWCRAD